MTLLRPFALFFGLLLANIGWADTYEPVKLDPIKFGPAELVVVGRDGEATYDPLALERLGTYRLTTRTPWRTEPATFEGVMLNDLLARHGLDRVEELKITAENDFEVTIPGDILHDVPFMIATRVDGAPHTRRARGPLQFIIPMDMYEEMGLTERYWVWMAARIEPAE